MSNGTLVICRDVDDMVDTMKQLSACGIETDFKYNVPGHDYVLEVTKVEKNGKR